MKTMTLSCALDTVADDANDATGSSWPESRSTTWLTVCAGAVIMLALALALTFQLPAFYSSANEKSAASIVTDINEFSSSANVTYVDVNAQQCFACTGAIKGSPFIVRIEDAGLQACTHSHNKPSKRSGSVEAKAGGGRGADIARAPLRALIAIPL